MCVWASKRPFFGEPYRARWNTFYDDLIDLDCKLQEFEKFKNI